MAVTCIWADTVYSATTTGFSFVIKKGSTEIHRGIAEPYPDGVVRINVSKICEPYMPKQDIPDYEDADLVYFSGSTAQFSLYRVTDGTQILLKTWTFINNWSYEDSTISEDRYLSNPINGRIDGRMRLFVTQYREDSEN